MWLTLILLFQTAYGYSKKNFGRALFSLKTDLTPIFWKKPCSRLYAHNSLGFTSFLQKPFAPYMFGGFFFIERVDKPKEKPYQRDIGTNLFYGRSILVLILFTRKLKKGHRHKLFVSATSIEPRMKW